MRIRCAAVLVLCVFSLFASAQAVIPDRNVNMVSGTTWPGGDPYLQRQNEPSIAVSTRNALHLLAAANDYRTVDMPGLENTEEIGDAWLGVFRSYDGGNTWTSTLLPGYPQDTSLAGMSSPLKGYAAGADPVVRASANGLFYFSGIVLNRGDNPLGAVFVARYLDFNDHESSRLVDESKQSIRYVDTKAIQKGTAGQFNDKAWIATDIPRAGSLPCNVAGQRVDGGNAYIAWTVLVGGDQNIRSKMMVARSTDCGNTWQAPTKLSESNAINQGASIAIDPSSGAVYVVWRRITNGIESNALLVAKSTDFGQTFSKPLVIRNIYPFEQGTTPLSFRTTAFPSATVDDSGRVYIVWSERTANGDGRVALITSADGQSWSSPSYVVSDANVRGHQFVPSISFANGKLTLAWYDQREDHTTGIYEPVLDNGHLTGLYTEHRIPQGHLALNLPEYVFNTYIQEIGPNNTHLLRRHTLDVYVAQAANGAMPVFQSARASQYSFGSRHEPAANGDFVIEQLQYNAANLPLFKLGTVPFIGDYIDIATQLLSGGAGSSPASMQSEPVRHVVWTDNRDVRPPLDGNWRNYTPVGSTGDEASKFDSTIKSPKCVPNQTGMRNQNIYTARITNGLFAGSPGNTKPFRTPDGQPLQRAFVVFVQNTLRQAKTYRLTILNQPTGGKASFLQLPEAGFPDPLTTLDVTIPPRSSIARTVFATSSEKYDEIQVAVQEITAPDGTIVNGGLESVVVLNPDIANPDIANPDIANPDIANPDIANAEVYNPDIANPDIANPDIANPDIANPDIANPDIANPDIANPDIANPDIANPDIANPDIANPDIANPDIANPDIANGSVSDTTWETTNQGNTAASYSVNLLLNGQAPPAFKLQLILHRIYTTPAAGYTTPCALVPERHTVLFANINNPEFTAPGDLASSDVTDPSAKNATIWLLPGETMRITLRVVDPNRFDNITFNAAEQVTPVAVAHAINTADLASGNPQPPISLTITTTRIPDPITGTPYSTQLAAIGGSGAKHWTATGLPSGLAISDAGVVSGIPTAAGNYTIIATATDSATSPHASTAYIVARVVDPLSIPAQTLATGATGQAYSATLTRNGGVAPFTWSLASGSLPTGLTLSPGGVISGTPTVVQQTTFTVQVTDATFPTAQTATRTLSLDTAGAMLLTFLTQPVSIVEGDPQNQIVIRAQDATGAVLPGITMFLSVGQTPCNSSASVQSTVTDVTGIARFAAPPRVDACYGYTYRATAAAPGYAATPVDSNLFDVYGFGIGGITIAATVDQTATLLANGKILIHGGTISPNNTLCQGELYDPSTRRTDVIPSSTVCRAGHTATRLPNGSVLIAGGHAGSNANGDLGMQSTYELYDSATNTFAIAGNLPVAVAYNTATLLPNGSVLLAGGRGSTAAVKAIQIYDGTSWSSTMTLTTARYNHTATLVGDYVVIAGGEDETGQKLSSVELINWKLGTVTSGGLLNEARTRHGASLLGDSRILITGGYAGLTLTSLISSVEIYDPFTATSTPAGKMGSTRTNHIAQTLSDGTVLVAGGAQSIKNLELGTSLALTNTAEVYNPATKTFSFVGGLSAARWNMSAVPLQGADGRPRLLAIRGEELDANSNLVTVPTVEMFYAPPVALTAVDDPLNHGTVDVDYYATLNSVGGIGSRKWALVEGPLPPGITLSASGVLSGKPTASGVFPFTVRVTDSAATPATATLSTSISIWQMQTLLTNLEYPTGLAIGNEKIYITETAGRNTTFGGAIRLRDYDTVTHATSILLDKPTNSDAVVALTSTQLYLGSYVGSIPGDSGAVSVATFNATAGTWSESPVTSLAIAVSDMYLDSNGDIYVIGESDNPDAASLYRLPAGNYGAPVVVKRGLARASSMTMAGTMTYYGQFQTYEVRRFNADIDELFFSGVTVLSLTSDGTWIYYAQFSPGNFVKRRNIATGAEEILDSGPAQYNAVRYDAAQHKLYILEGGTAAAQFKDGKLKVLSGL